MNSILYDHYDEQGLIDLKWHLLQGFVEALPPIEVPGGISMGYRITREDLTLQPPKDLVPCLRPALGWGSANLSGDTFDTLSVHDPEDRFPDLPGPTMLLLYWQAWEASTKLSVVFHGRPGKTWATSLETIRVLPETRAEVQRWIPWPDMADILRGAGSPPYPGSARGKTLEALQEVQRLMGRAHAGAHLRTPWL